MSDEGAGPRAYPNRYEEVTVGPCPASLVTSAIGWAAFHCQTNSKAAALWLTEHGVSAEVVWGLASLPYSRWVNDPEKWRAHVWIRVGKSYCDPTYEYSWGPSGQEQGRVAYFRDTDICLQPGDAEYSEGLGRVETGVPRVSWTVASIRAVAEGDCDVHETERTTSPFDLRVHQGQSRRVQRASDVSPVSTSRRAATTHGSRSRCRTGSKRTPGC